MEASIVISIIAIVISVFGTLLNAILSRRLLRDIEEDQRVKQINREIYKYRVIDEPVAVVMVGKKNSDDYYG